MSKGTSQKERMPDALDPESFNVDDRSVHDLFKEAQKFAELLAFYKTSLNVNDGNWAPFLDKGAAFLDQPSSVDDGKCPPQLGLLIAFFKLFRYPQQQLNALTSSHLHFFYQRILAQRKRLSKPDKVYVFFKLVKNIDTYLLPGQADLIAGKDAQGNNIIYSTDRQISLGQASISQFKVIRNQKNSDGTISAYPAANSSDGFGAPLKEGQGWHPFGNQEMAEATADIGFGISSPVLFLKEGVRTIYITLSIIGKNDSELRALDPGAFDLLYTSPEGWATKNVKEIRYQNNNLTFLVQLNETDPAVVGFNKTKHDYELNKHDRPLIIFRLKRGFSYSRYAFMQSFRFTKVTVRADVEKVRTSLARNDFGELDTNRVFHPFGYRPVKGDNLYLGYQETFVKNLSGLSLEIKWKGLPENFKAYYEGYLGFTNSLVIANQDFKVKAAIYHQNEWLEVKNRSVKTGEFPLFSERLKLDIAKGNEDRYSGSYQKAMKSEDGLIRLTLSSPDDAFGHVLYPKVYAEAIRSQLREKTVPIPNEPYTPIIESVELDYSSEEEAERFFYVKPFGLEEIKITNNPLISDEFHHAGSLYLGIELLNPPQQLAIFFDIDEEAHKVKPDLLLYYLSNSGWNRLDENQILSDTTLGLKQTGILLVNLPGDLSYGDPAMPSGFHWIRISIPDRPENFGRILSVKTNVASCTLSHDQKPEEFEVNSLPPYSIQKFSQRIAEIKEIEQPYSSFGGRPAEKETDFFTRVSEKLRHKMRSISSWDMERMILDQFPEIYKVWCLPHRNANGRTVPGNIHIIVIPFLNRFRQSKVLIPMVTESTLTEIKNFIGNVSSPNIRIDVTNPEYIKIKILARVSFSIQVDAGYYVEQLQFDLQSFLSPWAFRDEMEAHLGDTLYRSSIIEFIESRDYVNFIASIRILKNGQTVEEEEISPEAHTLIVSSETHDIEAADPSRVICQTNQGIEQMIIDINFEVQ